MWSQDARRRIVRAVLGYEGSLKGGPPRERARRPVGRRAADANGVFPVKVVKDGGVAGGSTNCTFTYTVKACDGTTLATGVAPRRARHPLVIYLPGGEGGRSDWGEACWDGNTLVLLVALGEIEDQTACSYYY